MAISSRAATHQVHIARIAEERRGRLLLDFSGDWLGLPRLGLVANRQLPGPGPSPGHLPSPTQSGPGTRPSTHAPTRDGFHPARRETGGGAYQHAYGGTPSEYQRAKK